MSKSLNNGESFRCLFIRQTTCVRSFIVIQEGETSVWQCTSLSSRFSGSRDGLAPGSGSGWPSSTYKWNFMSIVICFFWSTNQNEDVSSIAIVYVWCHRSTWSLGQHNKLVYKRVVLAGIKSVVLQPPTMPHLCTWLNKGLGSGLKRHYSDKTNHHRPSPWH